MARTRSAWERLWIGPALVVGIAAATLVLDGRTGLVPLVGASGAISGVMGAYVLLFPRAKVLTLIPAGWYWFTMRMPAWVFLGVYIVVQNLFPVFRGSQGAVAYWAHIGGFAAGAALIYLFPHRKPPQRPARAVTGRFFDGEADFEI